MAYILGLVLSLDRKQAINYGKSLTVPFVAIINGLDLELWNTTSGTQMHLRSAKGGTTMLPHRSTLPGLKRKLQANPTLTNLEQSDDSLPFRPVLPRLIFVRRLQHALVWAAGFPWRVGRHELVWLPYGRNESRTRRFVLAATGGHSMGKSSYSTWQYRPVRRRHRA